MRRRLTDSRTYARLQLLTLVFLERCKPFGLWRDISFVTGLLDTPLYRRRGAEEETARVPCECKALTSFRHTYLGSFFLDPKDVLNLILGVIKNFSRTPVALTSDYGAQGACPKRPSWTETKRTHTHLLFCFILFRMWHCVILQRVRVPSYSESSSQRRIVGKAAAPVISRHPRRLVWIFIRIISVTHENPSELYWSACCLQHFCIIALLNRHWDAFHHWTDQHGVTF